MSYNPKFLCMCQGGNVRSVSLGFVLKYHHKQDAIACGWEGNSAETLKMLFEWSDYIICMQAAFKEKVPVEYHSKIRIVDVGPDNYGTPMHGQLLDFLKGVVNEWKARGYKI